MKRLISFCVLAFMLILQPAMADQIAKVETSGLFMKDSIEIHAFNDPTIAGVACYVTMPKRSLSFEDQTNASIACRQIGKITGTLGPLQGVFSSNKNLFFKNFRVDRFFDAKRQVLIYLAYTKKLTGDNASHSISVVPLTD